MRIIIVSMIFNPENRIGAVRPTNFAKYLFEKGHHVTVITRYNSMRNEVNSYDYKLYEVEDGKLVKCIDRILDKNRSRKKNKKVDNSITKFVKNSPKASKKIIVLQLIDIIKGKDFARKGIKIVKKVINDEPFDIVISSYGPIGSLYLGEKITDNHYAEKWICDYRDRLALKYYPNWLRKIYLRIEKRAHKKSNATFQVSKGTMDDYVNDFKNIELENLHIITNGYEKVNKSLKNFSSEKLIFSYTGSLYSGGKRSFKILSEVIKQCAEEGTIDIDKVIIKYAGNSTEELNKQIKEFGIDIFENYGSVSRERAIEIQNESDILILLTWNTKNEKGVITGKFYEYLIAHKPIICLISGNEPNSELSLLIRETNVGISCEEINYNLEFKMLKNYLIGQYNNKMLYGSVKYEGNNKEIDKYDYKNIVDKVESICKSS